MSGTSSNATAVVMGGSIAGLATAGALAPFFDRVVVLEQDPSAESMMSGKGVPQAAHIHYLPEGGCGAFESLFPGFTAKLAAMGARVADFQRDVDYLVGGVWLKKHASGNKTYMQRRSVTDAALRAAVLETHPNIDVVWGARVRRVDGTRVTYAVAGDAALELAADFLVDATGRSSAFARAYATSTSETMVKLMYSTMEFELDPATAAAPDVVQGIGMFPTRDDPRGAALMRLPNNRVLAMLIGYHGGRPTDAKTVESWMATLASLPHSRVYDVVKSAKPVWDKPKPFTFDNMYRRRFANLPPNVLVVGDAAASLDPLFGQGMTKAALEAVAIRAAFARKRTCAQSDLAHLASVHHVIDCVEVSRHAGTTGYVPPLAWVALKFVDMTFKAASVDTVVYDELMHAFHFTKHPFAMVLTVPRILFRAAFG